MAERFFDFILKVQKDIWDLSNINFNEIHYPNLSNSLIIGFILLVLVTVKIMLKFAKPDSRSQRESGHNIEKGYLRGYIFSFIYLAPKMMLAVIMIGFLAALADPFINKPSEETRTIETRIRVDLRDGSSSMEQTVFGTKKSKLQVAAESHLRFLELRKGKNDRTSFWLFASYPHLIEDFIVDDELYYNQVADAPWVIYSNPDEFFQERLGSLIPRDRVSPIAVDGGGTSLHLALQAVIKQFDNDPSSQGNEKKAVLIVSDAEVYSFPAQELAEMQNRNIVPYVLLIRSPLVKSFDPQGKPILSPPRYMPLLERIREFGGEFFDVVDEQSIQKAYEAIDKLETVEVNINKTVLQNHIFQIFLLISIIILSTTVFISFLLEPFDIYP